MLSMGTVLDNRYRIVRYLASGGFGNTYVAEDTRLGGQVAVKEFFMRGTNHRSADGTTVEVSNDTNTPVFKTQLEKFKREARRIFELRNDHIIHVSDLFDANGTSYYIMDYVKGTSLANQTLSESDAKDVFLQVLDALETMHKAGLYHLDVKPGNIMRDTNGHCILIDFGASKQLSADERNTLSSSTMAYTPGYAPVEQVTQQSKEIGPWTDFYALGATLYRLVTGTTPPEVSVTDFTPEGRQFPYPKRISTTIRHTVSTLMNSMHTLRPQNADEVRALLEGTSISIDKPILEKESKSEETIYDNPTPSSADEKTKRTASSTPRSSSEKSPKKQHPFTPTQFTSDKSNSYQKSSNKGLWYTLGSIATMILLTVLLVNYGGCHRKTPAIAGTDTTSIPTTSYETCPNDNHPHAIDLGLPSGTKWACCNIGAKSPEDYGGYYAWGETEEKDNYDWKNYSHSDGAEETCKNLGTSLAGTSYDVAHVKWGNTWQMPSLEQARELQESCIYKWTSFNEIMGGMYISRANGATIFLPAAGYYADPGLVRSGEYGNYWLCTPDDDDVSPFSLSCYKEATNTPCFYSVCAGLTVRPVCK